MNKDDLYYFGKILKPFGSKGHLLVFMDIDDPEFYEELQSVFIEIDNTFIPWVIVSFEIRDNNHAILLLEDINETEVPSFFTGREMYLPLAALPPRKGKKFSHREITGFIVIDKKQGNIGTVTSVLELPLHNVLQVHNGSREILVPMAGDIVLKIDRKHKEIHIQAPEGLIDLYLG
ncbi:MAG: ribosome maturation factor RimM [Bacteroidetes bacterium]|nr:ribosome maturation factor RimM [Bacteroidota bacterium]